MLQWIEAHPGLAAWAQASGAILAIIGAFLIAYAGRRHLALNVLTISRRLGHGSPTITLSVCVDICSRIRMIGQRRSWKATFSKAKCRLDE
jgi:hypothetical protein